MSDDTNLHVKPTPEELEANAQKYLAEAEAIKAKEEAELAAKSEETEEKEEEKTEELSEKEEKEEEKEEENDEVEVYKKKFIENSRENLILNLKNKKLTEVIDKVDNLPEPTEDELKSKYPTWDKMDDSMKLIAKENFIHSRQLSVLSEFNKESRSIDEWTKKVDSFLEDPITAQKFPKLEGKEEAFKNFSTKASRRGLDFPDLVDAFLYNHEESKEKKEVDNKKSMFPSGSGGPNAKSKAQAGMLTIEQSAKLRETDYRKYTEYLNAGKIEQLPS